MVARWGLVLVVVLVIVGEPHDLRADGATLPRGRGAVSLTLQTGLSEGQGAEPLSVAPDAWYGLSGRHQIGLVTSVQGLYGFWSGAVTGLSGSGACLSGKPDDAGDAGCSGLFESGGIETMVDAGGWLVANVGLHLVEDEPRTVRVKTAARGRWQVDRLSIGVTTSFMVNPDSLLLVPVEVGYAVADRLRVGLQSGYLRYFPEEGDDWSAIPVAAGVVFLVTPTLVTAASFSFDRVGGYEGPGPFDQRSASLMVGTML